MPASAADEGPERLHLARLIEVPMKDLVGGGEGLDILSLHERLLLGQAGFQSRDQPWVGSMRKIPHQFELKGTPQEMRLPGKRQVDGADDGGMLRKDLDEPFLLQPHQRIANGRRAYSVLSGEGVTGEDRARRQGKGQDRFPHPFEDLGSRLATAFKALGHGDREGVRCCA